MPGPKGVDSVVRRGQVGAEIPIDSDEADESTLKDRKTLLYVLERGCAAPAKPPAQAKPGVKRNPFKADFCEAVGKRPGASA